MCGNYRIGRMEVRGRGASSNPGNRFEKTFYETSEWDEPGDPHPQTVFLRDETRSIINYNDSPDGGFNASINPYRGCEHGCIYCFARPYHEYLGFSCGLDFETKLMAKPDAPKAQLAVGGGTDNPQFALIDTATKQPVANGARNLWVTETALTTALNTSYMADRLGLFGIVVGIALLLSGIGFIILASAALHRPKTAALQR